MHKGNNHTQALRGHLKHVTPLFDVGALLRPGGDHLGTNLKPSRGHVGGIGMNRITVWDVRSLLLSGAM